MTVAVLALQGAFAEHEKVLQRLGVNCIELRQANLTMHLYCREAKVPFRESF